MATAAKVVTVQGEAFARSANGTMRRLAAGDSIEQGEVVITSAGGAASLRTADGQMMSINSQESFKFGPESIEATAPGAGESALAAGAPAATVIQPGEINVEQLLADEAAAAGLAGGGENGGNSFVRLMRISEEVNPNSFDFQDPAGAGLLNSLGLDGTDDGVPIAGDLVINLDEDDIRYEQGVDFRETAWVGAFEDSLGVVAGGYYDNGNSDEAPGDDVPDPSPTTMSGNLNFNYGEDGMGDIKFNTPTAALTSGPDDLPVQYWMSADGHTLVGYVVENYEPREDYEPREERVSLQDTDYIPQTYVKVIFSAEITDVETGAFSFTLYGPLDHPDSSTEDNLTIPFGFTVTDIDGDPAIGTLTVNLDDDSPVLLGGETDEYGNVVNGTIYSTGNYGEDNYGEDGENTSIALDTWNFTVNQSGIVTIDVLSREDDAASDGNSVDVNQDGELSGLHDSQIWVFRVNDDGSLGESIEYNDDGYLPGGGYANTDGSIHPYDSYLSLDLAAGNYAVVIGPLYFDEDEARAGVTNYGSLYAPASNNDHADYQLTFGGNVTVTGGPGDGASSGPPGDTIELEEDDLVPAGEDEDGSVDNYTASGTIVDDVAWGADGFGSVTKVTIGTGEDAVSFDVPASGSKSVYFDANGDLMPETPVTYVSEPVTTPTPAAELVVNSDGTYTITILTAMNHGPNGSDGEDGTLDAEENWLQLPAIAITGVDGDGDPVNVPLNISVQDDVPVQGEDASVSARVDEDDIRTDLSLGTSPNDGAGWPSYDGSYTGPAGIGGPGPANVTGSVASLVSFGTDGPGDNGFSLSDDFNGLMEQNLRSKGEELSYRVEGDTLIAYVGTDEQVARVASMTTELPVQEDDASERVVFTLQLDSDGDYTFSLYDQLDHASPLPPAPVPTISTFNSDAPAQINPSEMLPIDLSSVIVATDADGDSITLDGNFTINVADDVPVEADHQATYGVVEEEALTGGNQELDDSTEWVWNWRQGLHEVPVDGWPDTAVATGSVASQVEVGADDDIAFSLSLTQSRLPQLTSNHESVSYSVVGNTLYAYVPSADTLRTTTIVDTQPVNGRVVFTLQLQENGDYTFTLMDQLDHSSECWSAEENLMALNLSSVILATDFDGDSIRLDNDFYIKVVDDIPVVSIDGPGFVLEDGAAIEGTWNVSMGADQPGSIAVWVNGQSYAVGQSIPVVESSWWASPQTVGTLTVNGNGSWTFDPNPNLDNLDFGNWVRDTEFSFTIKATDADGDRVSDSQTISVLDGTNPPLAGTISLALDEEALGNTNATGTNPDSGAEQVSNTLSFTAGSDDLSGFSFSTYTGGLLRNTDGVAGNELTWVRDSATQITGHFGSINGAVAITLALSAPSSIANGTTGLVTVTATLSDNLKHELASGEQVLNLGSVRVYAYDHDGDSTYGIVNLSVTDDVPVGKDDTATVGEDAQSIYIDVLSNDSVGADEPLTLVSVTQPAMGSGSVAIVNNKVVFSPGNDFQDLGENVVTFNDGNDWDGLTIKARSFELPVGTGDLSESQFNSDVVYFGTNGQGTNVIAVNGGRPDGHALNDETEYDSRNGKTEALLVTFAGPVSSATVTFSEFYGWGEHEYEWAKVSAYDADGDYIGSQSVKGSTIGSPTHTFTFGALFTSLVFEGLPYGDETTGTDSSDFGIAGITATMPETADVSFTYTAQDADGDPITQTVTVTVVGSNDAPEAVADVVITNKFGGDGTTEINIPTWALLANDADVDANDVLSVASVSNPVSLSVELADPDVAVVDPTAIFSWNDTAKGGSFDYSVSDGALEDTGSVIVTRVREDSLTGSDANEILIASENRVFGVSWGTDMDGGKGNDILLGSSGNEEIKGGQGSDTLVGGGGDDTFKWSLNDATGSGVHDVIKDFDATGSDHDVLNLKDLLQGESYGSTSADPDYNNHTLDNYLVFSKSGEDTVLTVTNTKGGSTAGGNTQTITFQDTDLFVDLGADSSHALIAQMIKNDVLKD